MIDYNKLNNEELCELYQSGDETALHYLCINNHGLAEKIASNYYGLYHHALEFEDLKQLAYIGIINAAQHYQSDKGSKFVSYCYQYAQWVIHRAISRNGYIMNFPGPYWSKLQQIIKLKNFYTLEISNEAEIKKQIAEDMGISLKKLDDYWYNINCVMIYATLSAHAGEDENDTLLNLIPDSVSAEDIAIDNSVTDSLDIILNKLPEREKEIIKMKYYYEMTFDKISKIMNISRQRVQQLEKKALKTLRNLAHQYDLQVYLT